jgi:protoporphyrinogen IX oxidase
MIDALNWALAMTYVWLKAGHIIFVIFWIAGLFMLPRFYVYHQEAPEGSDEEQRWIERERKLRTIILIPAIGFVWLFGLALAYVTDAWTQGWFQGKVVLVLALSAYQGWMVRYGKRLAAGGPRIDNRTLRMMNEIPGIAVIFIVALVVVGRAFS